MASVPAELENILKAVYGRDMRSAIYNAIKGTYTGAVVNPIKSSGLPAITPDNYQANSIYDANDFPMNECISLTNTITSAMVLNLPSYGHAMNILTYIHNPGQEFDTSHWGAVQIAVVWSDGVYYRYRQNAGTDPVTYVWADWKKLANDDDGGLPDKLADAFTEVQSKNLYDKNSVNHVNGYMLNETVDPLYAMETYAFSGLIPCKPNTTYTFSTTAAIIKSVYVNGNTIINEDRFSSSSAATFVTPDNCTAVGFNLFGTTHTDAQYQDAINNAQLEAGSVKTPYEAYLDTVVLKLDNLEEGKTIKGISNIGEVSHGINLYDKSLAEDGKYCNKGTIYPGTAAITGLIPVEPNTQYCFSVSEEFDKIISTSILQFDGNGTYTSNILTTVSNSSSLPFVTGENTHLVLLNFYLSVEHTSEQFNAIVNTMMLEKGSCRGAEYVPYKDEINISKDKIKDNSFFDLFDLSGKNWISIGTSITWYNSNFYQAGVSAGKLCRGYQSYVTKYLGLNLTNLGSSGSTLSNTRSDSLINRYTSIDWKQYDIATLEYGVNDLGNNIPAETFEADYRTIIDYILKDNPNIKLIICTDPDVRWTNLNHNGNTLKDFADATIRVANDFRLPLCDWFYRSGISGLTKGEATQQDYLTVDGTHPNDKGHERMGKMLIKTMVFI